MFVSRKCISILVGAVLLGSAGGVLSDNARRCCADDPLTKQPTREEIEKKRKEDWKKLSPEAREAKRKEIKARLEKRIAELREKQVNGTIIPQEARELSRSEQILKRFEQNAAGVKKADGTNSVPQIK